jgi:multidrug efflux system membrane fusion protein
MTSRKKRWALVGAGLGLIASVSGAALFFELPMSTTATAASAPAQAPAVPVTVAVVASARRDGLGEFSGRLEAVDRVQVRSRVAGAIQSVAFPRRRAGEAGRPALHHRSGALPGKRGAGARPGRLGSRPGSASRRRTRPRPQAFRQQAPSRRAISISVRVRLHRGAGQSAFRTGGAAVGPARSRLYAGPGSGFRPRRQARGYRRQPRCGRLGFAGADDAGFGRSDLCELQRQRRDGDRALAQLPQTDGALPPVEQIPVEVGTLADSGTPIKGKLQLIDNEVDASSGTIGVRAVFDNPGGRLIPGQFVRVRMGQPKAENKLDHQRTRRRHRPGQEVRLRRRCRKQGRLPAGPARHTGRWSAVVESGLAAGDKIVVNGLQRIRPGAVVAPQMEEKVATAQ